MSLLSSSNTDYGDRTLEVFYKDGSTEEFEITKFSVVRGDFIVGLQDSQEEIWINRDSIKKLIDYKESEGEK